MILEYRRLLSYHVPSLLLQVKHAQQLLAHGKHFRNICYSAVVAAAPATPNTAAVITSTTTTGSAPSKLLGENTEFSPIAQSNKIIHL